MQQHMFERIKRWTGILLGMLSLHLKDGRQECLWVCSVFSKKFYLKEKERPL
jgi:hypothetical protein